MTEDKKKDNIEELFDIVETEENVDTFDLDNLPDLASSAI